MPRAIDYLFTLQSPWAYLGSAPFHALARKHGLAIRYRPVTLLEVFNETGGLPLAKRHPARQAYRLVELQRWRAAREVPLNLKPKGFPFDATLADCVVIALQDEGHAPEAYLTAAHRAVWAEDRNMADEAEIARLLDAAGENAAAILAAAKGPAVQAAYVANRGWALEAGIFGAPSYVLDGEIFWGQDRLGLLDDALKSARPAYRPDGQA
jgi:2-hydroxychromene-2-carboxylate isomerase